MLRIIFVFMILLSVPTNLPAQIISEEDENEITKLDRRAIAKVLEAIKPSVDAQNKKTIKLWQKSGIESKIKECSKRRQNCISAAMHGGHENPVAETGRLYFCESSKEICGSYWQ